MAGVDRRKSKRDLIPQNIGAAWQRASQVRVRKFPHTDLREVLDWIVSVMTPAARSRLMSDLVDKGPGAAWAQQERRVGLRAPARKGRRKGARTPVRQGRRKGAGATALQGRRKSVRKSSARQASVRQERRKGSRPG